MSDYKVPKRQVDATARLLGGLERRWQIFLSEVAETRAGPERATDLFNRKTRFLPVKDHEDGHVVVSCANVLSVSVPADAEFTSDALGAEDLAAEMSVTTSVDVTLADGSTVSGTLVYLQPEGRRRLQDFLNEAPTFISVRDGDTAHLVNTQQVVQVRTVSNETASLEDTSGSAG